MTALVFSSAIGVAHAQPWPYYYGGHGYPPIQAAPMVRNPYPYGPMPAPAGPNVYYGEAPNGSADTGGPKIYYGDFPTANTPSPQPQVQSTPMPTYVPMQPSPAYSGGSIYYVNPNGTPYGYNYYPLAQQGKSLGWQAPQPRPAGWPTPTSKVTLAQNGDVEPSTRAELERLAAIPFHRETKDRFWLSADYQASILRSMRFASPLVTTGSAVDTFPGAIGQPTTSVLYPRSDVDFGILSGFKANAGIFLDDCDRISLDVLGFWLPATNARYSNAGDGAGNPVISRPVFVIAPDPIHEGAFVNSRPNLFTGTINVDIRSQIFGGELNARYHSYWWGQFRSELLAGFRYLNLRERLVVQEHLRPLAPGNLFFLGGNVNAPNELADQDTFATSNQFFGGQFGTRLAWEYRWFTLEGFAKLGLGASLQRTTIDGTTTLITPGGATTVAGGILALQTNSGTHSRTVVGLVPEFGLTVGVDVTQNVRVQLGYSFLMWSHVLRPGAQIDRNVNTTLPPGSPNYGPFAGPVAPVYRFNEELFWVHSFNLGLVIHY